MSRWGGDSEVVSVVVQVIDEDRESVGIDGLQRVRDHGWHLLVGQVAGECDAIGSSSDNSCTGVRIITNGGQGCTANAASSWYPPRAAVGGLLDRQAGVTEVTARSGAMQGLLGTVPPVSCILNRDYIF
jgi:hypothetical protein